MYGQFLPQQYVINNHGPKISGTKKKDMDLKGTSTLTTE